MIMRANSGSMILTNSYGVRWHVAAGDRKPDEGDLTEWEVLFSHVNPEEGSPESCRGPKLSSFCFSTLVVWAFHCHALRIVFCLQASCMPGRKKGKRSEFAQLTSYCLVLVTWPPLVTREAGNQAAYPALPSCPIRAGVLKARVRENVSWGGSWCFWP